MIAYFLNLIDLAFTLHALRHGAVELNPFMQNELVMISYKLFVVGALLWLLERLAKNFRVARWGLWFIAAAFAAVDVWHLLNIF